MAAKRVRDYKAEYARRQEVARAKGFKSYGARRYAAESPKRPPRPPRDPNAPLTPGQIRYRRDKDRRDRALEHILSELGKVPTKAKVNPATVRQNTRMMTKEETQRAMSADGEALRILAAFDARFRYK